MKHVLVTGTSSGIGRACAEKLANGGFHVFGSVRKSEDAAPLEASLGDSFTALTFDVTDAAMVRRAAVVVAEAVGDNGLFGLVNNAGTAVDGPLMHLPVDRLREQFDVNVFGVVTVTQAFLPLLGARRNVSFPPGRIVNVGSVSGRVAFPCMGAYAASKHALEAISDALRRELMIYGIDVVLIEPATVRTPMIGKAGAISPYRDTDYGAFHQAALDGAEATMETARPAAQVADAIHAALTSRKPRTRYVLAGRALRWLMMSRLMPDRWVDRKLTTALRRTAGG